MKNNLYLFYKKLTVNNYVIVTDAVTEILKDCKYSLFIYGYPNYDLIW